MLFRSVIIAVGHSQFSGLPKKDLDRMFKRDNSEKVIADVMGVLDKREFEKEGYIYWRL